ncbi:hypothetical protein BJ742DRAFT_801709 [Cladochytrium replicatum]|nr:hypothetical protein BJ742DRAFT_801709 [Cladochytrium replicatum]
MWSFASRAMGSSRSRSQPLPPPSKPPVLLSGVFHELDILCYRCKRELTKYCSELISKTINHGFIQPTSSRTGALHLASVLLPPTLCKYGMDLFYRWAGLSCQRPLFPLVCIDTLGSTWLLSSKFSCVTVIALLATSIVAFHTALATFYLVPSETQTRTFSSWRGGRFRSIRLRDGQAERRTGVE